MIKTKTKNLFSLLKDVFRISRPNTSFLLLSGFFIFIATLAQFAGLGMLIPVLNSMIDKSHFLSILTIPVLGNIIKALPFANSNLIIFLYMAAMVMIAIYVESLAVFASRILSARVAMQVEHSARIKVFERYLGFSRAFFDRQKAAELNSLLVAWTNSFSQVVIKLNELTVTSAFAVCFLIFMFITSWRLTLGVGVILWIGQNFTQWISKKISQSATEDYKERVKMAERAWTVIVNMPLVKSYANEENELKRFTDVSNETKRHSYNIRKKQQFVPLITDILNSTGLIIIVCISVFLYFYNNSYSLGRFLIYFVVLRRFILHAGQLNSIYANFVSQIAGITRVVWVFDDSDKTYVKSGLIRYGVIKNEIAFKNLSFSYTKDTPTLKNLNFRVKKGEIFAIVGPSGAGKTTIANLLVRFYEYDSGSIEIDDINIRNIELKTLSRNIGVVSQDTMLFNDTIRNNITYGMEELKIDNEKLDTVLKAAYIYDFVMGLPDKYDTLIGDRGVRLSGGEKQRVSIARALLKNPDILILDEATSALDTAAEMAIQKAIENIIKNRTVFVIAHRFSTIKNANGIIVVENGEIKEQGGLKELLEKKGKFYQYWEQQKLFY